MQQFRSGPVDNRILLLPFSTPRPHENRWRERSSLFRFYFNHIFFSFVAFVSFSGCRTAVWLRAPRFDLFYRVDMWPMGQWRRCGVVLCIHGTFFSVVHQSHGRICARHYISLFHGEHFDQATVQAMWNKKRRKNRNYNRPPRQLRLDVRAASDRHCTYRSRGDIRISEFISNEQFQRQKTVHPTLWVYLLRDGIHSVPHSFAYIFKSYFAPSQQYYVATADAKRI